MTAATRVIILGMDGLDPVILERLMEKGVLPHCKKLAASGTFRRLATTAPPLSPVAWASFATGVNPGKHGVFDFLKRDAATYRLDFSLTEEIDGRLKSSLKAVPFWHHLGERSVPSVILKCPLTYPAERLYGKMLSGLGTPDLCGTQGIFSFYTTQKAVVENVRSSGRVTRVMLTDNVARLEIVGPGDTRLPFIVTVGGDSVTISLGERQFIVRAGDWSPWVKVVFDDENRGVCRFFVKSVTPELELYVSPINFDPECPPFPVSYPGSFARRLAEDTGLFHTIGQASDTNVLNEGWLNTDEALAQYLQCLGEDERILFHELEQFRRGAFFFYFGITDTIQHMFLASEKMTRDPHPVEQIYARMDRIIGSVMPYVDKTTILIVLSDHGFGRFRRGVNLNSWLRDNGYLVLKKGNSVSAELFRDVDWDRTQAYAMGLAGIYLNRAGRETKGIVGSGKVQRLKDEIIARLQGLVDPQSGETAVRAVYDSSLLYAGPFAAAAPDLIVGYNPGWRASWHTALGGAPEAIFCDNTRQWAADHVFDSVTVPGTLLMNRKFDSASPHITDIAPTIISLLTQSLPQGMDGVPLL